MIRFPGRKPPRQHRRRLRPTWRNRVTRWEATLTPSEVGISLVYRARCVLTMSLCMCIYIYICVCVLGVHRSRQTDVVDIENQPLLLP